MRVLLVSEVYPPQIGGPSEQARQIAGGLVGRGHEVLVLTRTAGPEAGAARVRTVGAPDRPLGMAGRATSNLRLLKEMWREVEAFRPDVVHAQSAGYLALYAGLAARAYGIPTILKYSGSSVVEGTSTRGAGGIGARGRAKFLRAREASVLWLFRRVWVTTPSIARRLRSEFRLPGRRLWQHPNFIQLAELEAIARERAARGAGDSVQLVVVSRLKPHKGVHVAIEAVAALPAGRFRLRIVGDGPAEYIEGLRRRVEELGLEQAVEFHGPVAPGKVAEVYRASDVLLLPSFEEAFGIVLIEAMAAGVPVIASRVGGVPDVVEDGRTGTLVPAGDPRALAEAIEALTADPARIAARTAAGRARARDFSFEAGLDALVGSYTELIGGSSRQGRTR